jgi:hypothetical protein
VEVLGRYSNHADQGQRIQDLLEMVPEGSSETGSRTIKQVQHRLRPDEADELVRRYQTGAKVCELAVGFGIHRDTVSEILDRHDIPRRQRGIRPELVGEVVGCYQSGASLAKIGAQLCVDPGTVAMALRRAGVSLRPRPGWRLYSAED